MLAPDSLSRAAMRLVHDARDRRSSRVLVATFVLSLLVPGVLSLMPEPLPPTTDEPPLRASITELPPPPTAAAVPPAPKSTHRARRAPPVALATDALAALPEPSLPAASADVPQLAAAPQIDTGPTPQLEDAVPPIADVPAPPDLATVKALPPRVDLAYRVFLGTQGFYVGDATYRFEHDGNRYQIRSVGEARGLAALILRGQGKLESEGFITAAGLQPDEFALVRGKGRRREVARFDWNARVVSLDENKSDALEPPTYDPLTFLWQFYFLPPATDEQTFAIATTRKVYRYTFTRETNELVQMRSGPIEAERWHRRSEDGKTDAFVWLAPKLHYVAVKLRFSNTERGTVEALLDAIRVDDDTTVQ